MRKLVYFLTLLLASVGFSSPECIDYYKGSNAALPPVMNKVNHPILEQTGPFLNEHEFFTTANGDLVLYNYKTGKESWRMTDPIYGKFYGFTQLSLTPDKSRLIIIHAGRIVSLDLKTKKAKRTEVGDDIGFGKISEDGRHIYFAARDIYKYLVYDAVTLEKIIDAGTIRYFRDVETIEQSKDGRYVLFVRQSYGSRLYDTVTRTEISTTGLESVNNTAKKAFFLPDSTKILFKNFVTKSPYFEYDYSTNKTSPARIPEAASHEVFEQSSNKKSIILAGKIDGKFELKVYNGKTFKRKAYHFPMDKITEGYDITYKRALDVNGVKNLQFVLTKDGSPSLVVLFDTNSLRYSIREFDNAVMPVILAVTPDGRSLIGRDDKQISAWRYNFLELKE
jgi:hypothetical protein